MAGWLELLARDLPELLVVLPAALLVLGLLIWSTGERSLRWQILLFSAGLGACVGLKLPASVGLELQSWIGLSLGAVAGLIFGALGRRLLQTVLLASLVSLSVALFCVGIPEAPAPPPGPTSRPALVFYPHSLETSRQHVEHLSHVIQEVTQAKVAKMEPIERRQLWGASLLAGFFALVACYIVSRFMAMLLTATAGTGLMILALAMIFYFWGPKLGLSGPLDLLGTLASWHPYEGGVLAVWILLGMGIQYSFFHRRADKKPQVDPADAPQHRTDS